MTKTQRDSIIAVVMVMLCIGAGIRMFRMQKRAATVPAPAAAAAPAGPSGVEAQLLEDARFIGNVRSTKQVGEDQVSRWDQEWERDPFRAEEAAASGGIENLVLRGVFWDEETPRAIINNKTLRTGEAIDGYKVIDIRRRSVVLWTGEKNLELRVFPLPGQGPPPEEGAANASNPAPEAAKTDGPEVSEELVSKGRDFIKPDSFLAKLPGADKLNKSLKTVDAFATDTSGAESMMKMMGGTPEQIKQNLAVKDPKSGSSDNS